MWRRDEITLAPVRSKGQTLSTWISREVVMETAPPNQQLER